MEKVVVMARGLGKRMRRSQAHHELRQDQQDAAEKGVKALVPFDRPFLDYVLTDVADAGLRRICLVIGPEHEEIRQYYERVETQRLSFEFAVQDEPKGTADAVLAAAAFAGDDPFLVINSDNHYPADVLTQLRDLDGPGLASFDRDALVGGNVPADRIANFAVVEVDAEGYLVRVHEKPDPGELARLPTDLGVSMNCWRFGGDHIFDACRAIEPSARGEYEITAAVQHAAEHLGVRYRAVRVEAAVLDLTSRDDIDSVGPHLAQRSVRL